MDHSQLVELSEKAFSKLPSTPLTADDLVKEVLPESHIAPGMFFVPSPSSPFAAW